MINFIQKLVSYKSIDSNIEAMHQCMDDFRREAAAVVPYSKEYSFRDKPILVLSTHEGFDFDLIISGHIDVVPGKEGLFTLEERGGKLFGRGTYDMKAPLAASFFGFLDYLRAVGEANKLRIAFIITADEELDGLSVKHVASELGYRARFAIIPDGGSLDQIVIAQKGFWQFKLSFSGNKAHASRPWQTRNPIEKAHELFGILRKNFPDPKSESDWISSLSVTRMYSEAESLNTIPQSAELYFDMRFVTEEDREKVRSLVREYGDDIELRDIAYNQILDVDIHENFFGSLFLETMQVFNEKGVHLHRESGTSDAVFFAERGTPTVLFRPRGGDIHTDDEWVDKESLATVRKITQKFLEKAQEQKENKN